MKLLTVALLACSLHTVLGSYLINFWNDAGTEGYFQESCSKRVCQCFSGTQTNKLKNTSGGTVKAFSTTDCTGNYDTIAVGSTISNAQWVNSVSLGPAGTSYQVGTCGNIFSGETITCP